jgi:solute carrier family 35 protein F5
MAKTITSQLTGLPPPTDTDCIGSETMISDLEHNSLLHGGKPMVLPRHRHSRWLLGVGCVIFVAIIWTFASVLVQYVFHDLGFNRPFFLTYIANSLFAVNLPIWWTRRYFGCLRTEKQVGIRETLVISAMIAPLWFMANLTYNYSLNMTRYS